MISIRMISLLFSSLQSPSGVRWLAVVSPVRGPVGWAGLAHCASQEGALYEIYADGNMGVNNRAV